MLGSAAMIAGRSMPGSILRTKRDTAISAPVLPALTGSGTARLQLRLDGVAQPHQDDIDVRIGFQEIERRRHGDVRTMIAAHAIDGYCDFHEARCEAIPASLTGRADADSVRSLRPGGALLALGLDDLLAAIVTARADVMAQMHFARRRLDRERRIDEEIVSAVHAALRRGFLVLLDCHMGAPSNSCHRMVHASCRGTIGKARITSSSTSCPTSMRRAAITRSISSSASAISRRFSASCNSASIAMGSGSGSRQH